MKSVVIFGSYFRCSGPVRVQWFAGTENLPRNYVRTEEIVLKSRADTLTPPHCYLATDRCVAVVKFSLH